MRLPFSAIKCIIQLVSGQKTEGGIVVVDTIWRSIVVFFISALPLVESKGAILVARLWNLPFWLSATLCAIGSYIPVPVLLYHRQINHIHLTKKLWTIPESVQKHIERYGCWALLVLIAIPFTGLGCWLGALIARSSHMDKIRAAVCIFLGNLISIILLTGCVHGIVTAIEKLLGLL